MNVRSPRPTLLDRRASISVSDLPDHLSVSDLPPHSSHPLANSSLPRVNPRRPSAANLSFVPLTPIMASPLVTPEVAHAPTPAALVDTPGSQLAPDHAHAESDYITHHPSPANPTWTTSPPTPPPRSLTSIYSTPSSPARAIRHHSKSGTTVAHRTISRPSSFAHLAPSSLSQSYTPASPVTAPSSPTHVAHAPARRLSLPSDLSKPLPPRPGQRQDRALKDLPLVPAPLEPAPSDTDIEETLLPSLSRRAQADRKRSASLDSILGETRTLRVARRKLFELDAPEGDLSDDEDAEHGAYKKDRTRTEEEELREREMGQTLMREQEKDKAEGSRRYHALTELLTTEVGYLLDLRALVTVYLDQLALFSSPPNIPATSVQPSLPTPPLSMPLCLSVLPPPPRPMSTFSALSIPSLFPSSRSSFIQASPSPSPPSSASEPLSGPLTDNDRPSSRERQQSGGSTHTDGAIRERDRERECLDKTLPPKASKPGVGPILIEREVRAVCRNAQELLKFHERFVGELRDAVSVIGFRDAFLHPGEEQPVQRVKEADVTEMVDRAVEVVAEKFVCEAASFSIYETFCPGHAAATDLIRCVQERWPSAWDAYDQRCSLLVSHASLDVSPGESKDGSEHDISSPTSPVSELDESKSQPMASLRKRRHSTPTLSSVFPIPSSSDGAGSIHCALSLSPVSLPSATALLPVGEARGRGNNHKLKFMDYLIKPVQRLCKYPLLLEQLQDRRRNRSVSNGNVPVDGVVVGALEAMRGVVSRVNRASEKEAHNLRSALIASRIAFSSALPHSGTPLVASPTSLPPLSTPSSSACTTSSHSYTNSASSCSAVSTAPTSPASSSSTAFFVTAPRPRATSLTADFISSLGPCLLAGALDVVHHPASRARYLGVFLYVGGYCILAKITKNGKVYEPRHWFALSEVEVEDIEDDDVSFPYSFSISGFGHHLQLGSSCTQEKTRWLSAINEALAGKAVWKNQPLSSFQADDRTPPPLVGPLTDEPQEIPNGLPTIQSLSEPEKHSDAHHESTSSMPSPAILKYSKTLSKLDNTIVLKQDSHPQHNTISAALSRRSSTASVKAFFAPISFESSRITRPSSATRAQIDHALHDVFSESCQAARSHAQMRGEELFQVRVPASGGGRKQGGGMSRSNSGISIANAMGLGAAKRKYDMVARRNRSVDLDMPVPPLPPMPTDSGSSATETGTTANSGSGLTVRPKSLAMRRHKKPPASIAPAISTAISQMSADKEGTVSGGIMRSPEALSLDSPMLPSPVETVPLPIQIPGLSIKGTVRPSDVSPAKSAKPKRTRSMVENVRFLFQHSRPDSPSSSSDAERASPTPSLPIDGPPSDTSTGIVQWLRRTSIRRRPGLSSSSSASVEDQPSEHRLSLSKRNSSDGVDMRDSELLETSPRDHLRPTATSPKRHHSLFVASSRSRDRYSYSYDDHAFEETAPSPATPTRSHSTLSARKSLRNLLLFQRCNALTPVDSTR